jgi:hypothetical protein
METTTPSPKFYDFLDSFRIACEKLGLNHAIIFDYYFEQQYVFKGPDYLMLAGEEPGNDEAWHVFWAEVDPAKREPTMQSVRRFLRLMPYKRKWVCWHRLKNGSHTKRYYLTDRVLRLTSQGQPDPTT